MKRLPRRSDEIIIRLPNHLGDTLMTFPMLMSLQKSGFDFTCLGHPLAKDLFSGTDFKIVASAEIKNPSWCFNFYKQNNFSQGMLCTNTFRTVIPMRLAGLKPVGYHMLSCNTLNYDNSLHTVENYFELGRFFTKSKIKVEEISETIPISESNIEIGKKLVSEKIGTEYIVISPYATNLHKGKNKEWPYWQEFCKKIKKYNVVALVSNDDLERCKHEFPDINILSYGLALTAYIMQNARYVLANDSGPMHIASFFGAKTIGLLGVTEIKKTRPWYGEYLVGENDGFISTDKLLEKLDQKYN